MTLCVVIHSTGGFIIQERQIKRLEDKLDALIKDKK
jgi:hypothetical protein